MATTLVEYQYSQDLFQRHSSRIAHFKLRNGSLSTNAYISLNTSNIKPIVSVSSNTISRQWALNGRINPTGADTSYDIVAIGMNVDIVQVEQPIDINLFEDDYSNPTVSKTYNKLIIESTIPQVEVKYENYNKDYTGIYKITGIRSDDLANIRSWSLTGIANPSDPVAPTVNINLKMIVDTPDHLKDGANVQYPLYT